MEQGWTIFMELQATAVLVVFARLGTAMMFMPGFAETTIPGRHRLALALIMSLGLMPAAPVIAPSEPTLLAILLAREALIGAFLGLAARIIFSALHILGSLIAYVSSLSNALGQGQTDYEGSTVISSLLMLAGVLLIFITDTHHIMIRGLFASYEIIPPVWLPLGDLTRELLRFTANSLYIATMMGAPFLLLGIFLNLGLGLANRVMPGMPVFFVAGPAMVLLGIATLYLTAPAIMEHFSTRFAEIFFSFEVAPR